MTPPDSTDPPSPTTDPATTLPPLDPADTADYDPTNPPRIPTDLRPVPLAPPGYLIENELGRGGMGVVYKALQRGLNRPVALKMILTIDHADQKDLLRFMAEAEAVAAISHPHVINVFEYGEQHGRPYLAMEYLSGGNLADRLKRTGPMTPDDAAELVAKLARAVAAAHDQGIVHRDLKPANVLFDEVGEPRVSDFGLAKRTGQSELTRTGAVMGTPAYMAPEQAAGQTKFVGPAADVYALGVILFECIAGRRPFDDPDPVALIMQVATENAPRLRRIAPDAPKDLERICQKCMAKDPIDRYPSAIALAEDLTRFVNGEPVVAARPGVFDRLRSTLDRSKHTTEIAEYASIFLWLAGLVLAGEVINTLCIQGYLPAYVIRINNYSRVLLLVALLAYFRRGHLLPRTAMERYLWTVWGGYLVCCFVNGVCHWLRPGWTWAQEPELYQSNALLTALAFFSLAPAFWGWCYAFGSAFLAVTLLMAYDLRWAPLQFGVVWAAVLLIIGLRLRRLVKT
jgi:serine/threonine protein kinase